MVRGTSSLRRYIDRESCQKMSNDGVERSNIQVSNSEEQILSFPLSCTPVVQFSVSEGRSLI
jgi:hypothetical protein